MSKLGDDLIAALGQALAHARGDGSGIGTVHEIDLAREAVDVKAIRRRVGLKQAEMARIMNVSLSGYRKWEQNTRSVSGPARTMLVVMDRDPQAVIRALAPELGGMRGVVTTETGSGKSVKASPRRTPATIDSRAKRRRPEVA